MSSFLRFCLRPGTALLALGIAASVSPNAAFAQSTCDRSAMGQILKPSTGNIVGSLGGAALGGLIGNQFGSGAGKGALTAVGVVGGALGGGYIGRQMEGPDRGCVNHALESGAADRPVTWRSPKKNASYQVTPGATYQGKNGDECRNFTTQAVIDGRTQQVDGTACKGADGVWRTVDGSGQASADTIFKVQQRLRERGFYVTDNIDGTWGPKTAKAVVNFQRANGLNVSGQIDGETLAALELVPQTQAMQPAAVQQPAAAQGSSQPAAVPSQPAAAAPSQPAALTPVAETAPRQ